ncbi:transposase [Methylacidiphilum caldifontis]|uniref:zinc ribbon domain-containing protein n=1 Tax=Methylacidiphilum caldifontis TaxID=2795386 RepID=UPI001A8F3FFC|nr:transposase [Methylacidiphilum caldifontis]
MIFAKRVLFDTSLGYKLHGLGGWLRIVLAPYTSQTGPVPECGHVNQANRPRQTTFRCERCGYEGHANTVGAMNI